MKKLIYVLAGVLLAACVISSCKKETPFVPSQTDYIIAYTQVEPYNGKVNLEYPRSYEIEFDSEGSFYIVICDCDNVVTKGGGTLPSRRLAIPTPNPLFDESCMDRESVAYYRQLFSDSLREAVLCFNREER